MENEDTKVTETPSNSKASFDPGSFGEALRPAESGSPGEGTPVTPTTSEGTVPAAVVTPDPGETKSQAAAPAVTADPIPEPQERMVPVSALLKERAKWREREAAYLAQTEPQPLYRPEQIEQPMSVGETPQVDPKFVKATEYMAKTAHPDYDEKYEAFKAEVFDAETGQWKNRALYDSIMQSEIPGEAAYQAGKQLLVRQKYGVDAFQDPEKLIEKLREDVKKELEPQIAAKYESKIAGRIQEKNKQPTDISSARTMGTGGSEHFVPGSWNSALKEARKPHRR